MATPVIMPKQGQSVESCIITGWNKVKGDKVSRGDVLFSYETDKASFEEEAKTDGMLLEVFYEEGDEVPVLTNVAVLGQEGEPTESFRPGSAGIGSQAAGDAEAGPQPEGLKTDSGPAGGAEGGAGHAVDAAAGTRASGYNTGSGAAGGSEGDSGAGDLTAGSGKESGTEPEAAASAAAETGSGEKSPQATGKGEGKAKISPRARRLAERKGISYARLTGSGPNGRIIERDIERAMEESTRLTPKAKKALEEEELAYEGKGKGPAGAITYEDLKPTNQVYGDDFEDIKLTHVRKRIAKAMHASLQNSAQLTHHLSADARNILAARREVKKRQTGNYPHNITLNDMVVYATIRAIKKHPAANVHFLGESIRQFKKVHVGFAVDTERGLLVPVLKNADDLSLQGLSSQLKTLADACRSGNINPDLLASTAGSITISNLGNYGVEMFTPILNLPQACILGVNTIIQRPAQLEDGSFGFVPYIGLSLTYDHRAIDGGPATRFLAEIKKEIENFDAQNA